MRRSVSRLLAVIAAGALFVGSANAQPTMPPDGENQHAAVTQSLGLVDVTIDYHSPKVHNPASSEDRHGKIWGGLVPYGLVNLGFGTCKECPWRGGANQNTTFTVSQDVKINGQTLPAGAYALFVIPAPKQREVLLYKN